jgi:hypothetical protein
MDTDTERLMILREVLDCGSPLPLLRGEPAMRKRQRAAAVQDAGAFALPPVFIRVHPCPSVVAK